MLLPVNRPPLSPDQIAAGRRLGVALRSAPVRFPVSAPPRSTVCCPDGMVPSAIGAMLSTMLPFLLTRSISECSIWLSE